MQMHHLNHQFGNIYQSNSSRQSLPAEYDIRLQGLYSNKRLELGMFISDRYRKSYDADIYDFLPLLLDIRKGREILSVVGLKPGACGEFFLEQYLEMPVEQRIAQSINSPVSRESLIEIGNLVSSGGGTSLLLFVVMAAALEAARYRWMVFTGTPQIFKLIKRFDFTPLILENANPTT